MRAARRSGHHSRDGVNRLWSACIDLFDQLNDVGALDL
jgi:hypothetical protein